jgi:protein-arginine kinase
MEMIPSSWRATIDRLLIETQPAHLQHKAGKEIGPSERDALRAKIMREEFALMPTLTHIIGAQTAKPQEG